MEHNHPVALTINTMLDQRLDYIHENLVKVGFIDKSEAWVYSSARDYYGEKGMIAIYFLD